MRKTVVPQLDRGRGTIRVVTATGFAAIDACVRRVVVPAPAWRETVAPAATVEVVWLLMVNVILVVVAEATIIVPVTPVTVAMSPVNTLSPGRTFPDRKGRVMDVPVTGAVDVLVVN